MEQELPAGLGERQVTRFTEHQKSSRTAKSAAIMSAMDTINQRFEETLRIASTGNARPWQAQQQLSQQYTTRAEELLIGSAF